MGAASEVAKTCPECAEEIKAAARVCRHCGHRFTDVPMAPNERQQAFTPVKAQIKAEIRRHGVTAGKVLDEDRYSIEFALRSSDESIQRWITETLIRAPQILPRAPKRRWRVSIDQFGEIKQEHLGKVRYWQEGGLTGGPTPLQRRQNPGRAKASDIFYTVFGLFILFCLVGHLLGFW